MGKIIQSNPPNRRGVAHFFTGTAPGSTRANRPGLDQLDQVIKKFPDAKSESGLPLLADGSAETTRTGAVSN